MSPSVKLGLLTLVSSAAAIPHYSHSRFHKPSGGYGGPVGTGTGAAYPTDGYSHNHTRPHPSGTGASGEPTTTLLQTDYSTLTLYETVYATRVSSAVSAGAEDVSTGAASCGPETVYVTATNKVTVTVSAGASSSSSSSSAAVYAASSVQAVESSSSVNVPSSTAEAAASSSTSAYTPPAVYQASSVISSAAAAKSEEASVTLSLGQKAPSSVAAVYSSAAASSAVVSSAAPAQTSTTSSPSYSGAKRGLAYNDQSLCSHFTQGKFGFSYNWGQTGAACAGGSFVPMMHKPSDSTAEDWLANVDTAVKAGTTVVMGFNECDISTQANLSPEQACTDWKSYMNPIRAAHPHVTILGPSVSNSGSVDQGLDWLSKFNTACPDAEWDALNLHFYDIPDGDKCSDTVTRFQTHIDGATSTFGKKAWVTEFGLNKDSATSQQASDFLAGALSYLDGNDKCEGYAYFMVGTDSSMNELNDASGLSGTGSTYNS